MQQQSKKKNEAVLFRNSIRMLQCCIPVPEHRNRMQQCSGILNSGIPEPEQKKKECSEGGCNFKCYYKIITFITTAAKKQKSMQQKCREVCCMLQFRMLAVPDACSSNSNSKQRNKAACNNAAESKGMKIAEKQQCRERMKRKKKRKKQRKGRSRMLQSTKSTKN